MTAATPPLSIAFEVPGAPPSWKRRIVVWQGGKKRSFNDPKYEAARTAIAWQMTAAAGRGRARRLLEQRVSVRVEMWFPDRRVRDADRVLNAVLDAGKGILWKDDTWTTFEGCELTLVPRIDRKNPRIRVEVTAMGPRTI